MEVVRYRPSDALKWLGDGAETSYKEAGRIGKQLSDSPSFDVDFAKEKVRSAGLALLKLGKSTHQHFANHKAQSFEYILDSSEFTVIQRGKMQTIPYAQITRIKMESDRYSILHSSGTLEIEPCAYIVAGKAKAPIGWEREGHEVPFDFLIEEIAARSGLPIV